jgi:hypothetical protein
VCPYSPARVTPFPLLNNVFVVGGQHLQAGAAAAQCAPDHGGLWLQGLGPEHLPDDGLRGPASREYCPVVSSPCAAPPPAHCQALQVAVRHTVSTCTRPPPSFSVACPPCLLAVAALTVYQVNGARIAEGFEDRTLPMFNRKVSTVHAGALLLASCRLRRRGPVVRS